MFSIKNRRKVKAEIPKDTISSIPYDAAYINGIIKVHSGKFSKSYLLPEINYVSTNEEKQWNIAEEYAKFICSFDPSVRVFVTLYNRNDNGNEFVENIHITMKGDGLDEYRDEYNKIIEDKIKLANNNISMQAILTISLDAIDIFEADKKFSNQIDKLVSDYLTLITDETLLPVPIEERLDILNSIYNMENYTPLTEKKVVDGKLVETFSLQNCANQGISTKNAIAPAFMDVTDKRIRFNESTFCKTYMVRTFPSYLKGNVLTDFCSIPTSMLVTTVYDVKDTTEGIDEVKAKSLNVRTELVRKEKRASSAGYDHNLLSPDLCDANEETRMLLEKVTKEDDKIVNVTILFALFANSEDELSSFEAQLKIIASKHQLTLDVLTRRHEAGLNSCLPIGNMQIDNERLITTETVCSLSPYKVQNIYSPKGMYYGMHGISNRLIIYNRQNSINPNCAILGMPGSGKSFAAKREIINTLLNTDDEIYVIDPEGEYRPIVKALNGSLIRLSKGNKCYINPFDMTLDNADEDAPDPVKTKCEFIATIVEIMIGGRFGLSPIERTIIDQCTIDVYDEYLKYLNNNKLSQDFEEAPTLKDFYTVLSRQPQVEARNLALSLKRYVSGGVDAFAHHTNTDVTNRFTVYDIKDLGTGLKELGLQICLDNIWNKMIENKLKGKKTWFYIDEFYLLMQKPTSAAYISEIWKRARKWDGYPCAITQNVEDMLKSEEARTVINNCAFIVMMGQAPLNKQQLSKMYNLSPMEQKYIESPRPGTGLLRIENITVPMVDEFPKDTKLYKLMTTKPDERIV